MLTFALVASEANTIRVPAPRFTASRDAEPPARGMLVGGRASWWYGRRRNAPAYQLCSVPTTHDRENKRTHPVKKKACASIHAIKNTDATMWNTNSSFGELSRHLDALRLAETIIGRKYVLLGCLGCRMSMCSSALQLTCVSIYRCIMLMFCTPEDGEHAVRSRRYEPVDRL